MDAPASDQLEISLFGPGYGEALAIHIGKGRWVLVDSCLNPDNTPAAMAYLAGLERAEVVQIVATHWHDDHIRGISRLIEAAPDAQVVISSVLSRKEFLKLVAIHRGGVLANTSGIDEFAAVLRCLQRRKAGNARFGAPTCAVADRLLLRDLDALGEARPVSLYALSPSDAAILQAQLAFSQMMPVARAAKRRVASPRPNHASVALWLEAGEHRVLLGADLERTTDVETGWSAIAQRSTVVAGATAEVFKLPHHGSETGHAEEVWDGLVRDSTALLTPFNRGKKPLPTEEDLARIASRSREVLLTARPRTAKLRRPASTQKMINAVVRSMSPVNAGWGHVRLRTTPGAPSRAWTCELFGDAWRYGAA